MLRERGTKAYINIRHISHNLKIFKKLHPGKIIAVVKADAYGHGLKRVVPALSECDAFAVATLDEAIELRQIDSLKRIILLEGVFNEDELNTAIELKLDLVLHQNYQINLLESLSETAITDVWLKIDTGMNRLGFHVEEKDSKLMKLNNIPAIKTIRIMSHFATSGDVRCEQTATQIKLNSMLKKERFEYSFSNTGAVLNQLADANEWARVGLGLFGISPLEAGQWAADFDLLPAMTLTAKVIAVKNIAVGSQVGYGGYFKAKNAMQIGIVGIGYADGYPWSLHSSTVRIGDENVGVLGRVSMDMIAVDLSKFKRDMTGHEVIIWGVNKPIESVAKELKLIPYALTCGITNRVKYDVIQ